MSQSNRPDQLRQNVDFNSVLLVGFDQPEEGEQNLSVWNDQLSNYNKVVDCFNKQNQERNYMGSNNLSNGAQISAKNRMNSGSKQHENIRRSKQNQQQIHLSPPILLNSVQQNFPTSQQMSQTTTSQQTQLQQQNSGTNLQNYYQNHASSKAYNASNNPSQAILSSTTRGLLQAKSKKINSVQPHKSILSGLNEGSALNQNVQENYKNPGKSQQQQQQPQSQQQLQQGQQQQQNQQQQQQPQQQQEQQQQYIENNFFQFFGDQSKIKALIQQQSQQQQQLQQQVATNNTQINQNNSVFFQNKRPKQSDSTFDSTCSSTLVQESSYVTPRNTNKSLQSSFIQQGNLQNSQILNFNEMGGSCTPSQQQNTQFNNSQNNHQGVYRNRNSISTHQPYQNSSSTSTANNSIINNNNNSVIYYDSKLARQLSQLSVSDYSQQQQSQQQNTATTTPRGGNNNNNYSMILLHYPQHYVQGQNNFYNHHHRHLSFSNNSSSQQHSFILSQLQQSHHNQHSYSSNSNNQSFQGSQAFHAQPEIMFSPMIHNQSNDSISQNNCHLSSINSLNTSFQQNYTSQCQIDDQNKSRTYKSDSVHAIQQQQQQQQIFIDNSKQNNSTTSSQASQQNQSQFYAQNSSQKNTQINHPQIQQAPQQNQQSQNFQQQQNQTNNLLHYSQKFLQKPQGGIHRKNLSTSSKNNGGSQNYSNISILNNQKLDLLNNQPNSASSNDNQIQNQGNPTSNSSSNKPQQKNDPASQAAFQQLSRKVRSITNNMIEQSQILEEDDDKFEGEYLDDSNNESESEKKLKSDDQSKASKKAEKKNSKGTRKRKIIAQEEESNYLINPQNVKQDGRTTVMIKNIPNKYSLQALMEKIDQNHSKTYDFFYLPIDFRNKCNVGYAFINFIDPEFIKQFYEEFHNQKWAKFNSEKVCLLYYARLQGRNALIHHFQHSSVMNQKDKKLKPVILPKNEVIALEQLLKNQREEVRKASHSCSSEDQRCKSPNDNMNSKIQSNEQENQDSTPKQSYEKSQSKESIQSRGSNHNSSNHTLKDERCTIAQQNDVQNIQARSSSIKSSTLFNQTLNMSSISKSISPTNHEDIKQKQSQIIKSSTKKVSTCMTPQQHQHQQSSQ